MKLIKTGIERMEIGLIIGKLMLALFFLQTISCIEVKKKEKEEPKPVTESQASTEWSFAVEPLPSPQQYQVVLKWPSEYQKVIVVETLTSEASAQSTDKLNDAIQEKTLLEVKRGFQQFQFKDEVGQNYFKVENAFSFRRKINQREEKFYSVYDVTNPQNVSWLKTEKIKAPVDLVLNDKFELEQNTKWKIHRAFLGPHAVIKTNGFTLVIETEFLSAENSLIHSFDPGVRSVAPQPGRSGGTVSILAKSAVGKIIFQLNGESGGEGADGAPYAARGSQGAPGSGSRQECNEGLLSRACSCAANGGNGGKGAYGALGRPGIRGGDGGDSGEIILWIGSHRGFQIEDQSVAGEPGYSGKGGPGQQGGLGGLPGSGHGDCRWGAGGAEGDNGARGIDAPAAIKGVKKEICFQGVNRLDCPKF